MKAKGKDLEFISRIKKDGSGTVPIAEETVKILQRQNAVFCGEYELTRLSISEDTYIASAFNSYVVKLKTD